MVRALVAAITVGDTSAVLTYRLLRSGSRSSTAALFRQIIQDACARASLIGDQDVAPLCLREESSGGDSSCPRWTTTRGSRRRRGTPAPRPQAVAGAPNGRRLLAAADGIAEKLQLQPGGHSCVHSDGASWTGRFSCLLALGLTPRGAADGGLGSPAATKRQPGGWCVTPTLTLGFGRNRLHAVRRRRLLLPAE